MHVIQYICIQLVTSLFSVMGPADSLSKNTCFLICIHLEQDHGVKIWWNFFATSHGKGPVDGLGGSVKRSVWRHVKSGMSHIQ